MDRRICFDHAATTPTDPRVVEAMLPYLTSAWGNPSSIYSEARAARKGLDDARRVVAGVLGAKPNEIVFTSGGTEADNLALRGVVTASRTRGDHIIISAIEHHAVLHEREALAKEGVRVTYLPVDREGFVDLDALRARSTSARLLVSVMYANNEVGTIEPIAEVARIVHAHNPRIVVHTDAVQAAGQRSTQRRCARRRPALDRRAQVLRPEGRRARYTSAAAPRSPADTSAARRSATGAPAPRTSRAPLASRGAAAARPRSGRRATRTSRRSATAPGRAAAARPGHDYHRARGPRAAACRTAPASPSRTSKAKPYCCSSTCRASPRAAASRARRPRSSRRTCWPRWACPNAYLRGSLRLTLGNDNTMADIEYLLDVLPPAVERIRALAPA